LLAIEAPRTRDKCNPLVQIAKLYAKPTLTLSADVRANNAGGNLTPVRMGPSNSAGTDVRAGLDEALSSKPIQI